ncbi:MAG: DUF927 domain-containing protein [Methylococcaceae bacterium]|nr:MAG: DUF927 domain-containing protein [Methylococcaceae bacterium]
MNNQSSADNLKARAREAAGLTARLYSPGNPVEPFRNAMAEAGIVTDAALVADGVPAGWFKDFITGQEVTWRAGGGRWRMDEATKRQIAEDRTKREQERQVRYLVKACEARALWAAALPCHEHPYLSRKRVGAHGVRLCRGPWLKWYQDESGRWRRLAVNGALLVPLHDEHGTLWNVQAIFPDTLLVLDELGQDYGKEAGETAYMLANGTGKARAGRSGSVRETPSVKPSCANTAQPARPF